MHVDGVFREPFGLTPQVTRLPVGLSLYEMMERMELPREFRTEGVICINGFQVDRDCWRYVRPKAPGVTEVTFHMPLMGGEDGKNILSIIASIAITVASGWIAAGGLASKFGLTSFAANSTGALAAAGAVSLVGSLLVSALMPPPSIQTRGSNNQNLGAASAEGNVIEPNGAIPRVLGERKVYPPFGSEPFTYFDGPDEVVEAVCVLNGPHRIQDIRLGAASISAMSDIEYEVSEGWMGSQLLNLISRQSRTELVQSELRGHIVSEDDGRTLEITTGNTQTSLPQTQVLGTRDSPDEHQIQIMFGQGLHLKGSETDKIRVPIRLRIREIGGSWKNLPELHFQAANLRQMQATIRLVWQDMVSSTPSASNNEGFVEARVSSVGQVVAPVSADWVADSYFVGSGDVWMDANNLGSTAVVNTELTRYTAIFSLDSAVFPRGRYEIEVQRGAAFRLVNYSSSAYTYSSVVWDFFGYQGSPGQIVMTRDGLMDTLYLARSVSIWNEHPLPSRDLATIAIRARNRNVEKISCVAGGWVRDWDGTGWNSWVVTDNPAPHLRDIYVGAENMDPVPLDLLDDDSLVEWRQFCIDNNYTCNALIEDQSLEDASRIVAACGYGKSYRSDVWGVIWDRDRSAEAPVQMFTNRNMANFQWTRAFPRLPDGFRVNFRDKTRDYEMHQISVFRSETLSDGERMEQTTLEGIVDESDARARAAYDLAQPVLRGTFYSFDTSAENILCRRGSLIAVQHDSLHRWAGSARILSVTLDGFGDVSEIVLDSPVPFSSLPDMLASPNLLLEPNLLDMGVATSVGIRRNTGEVTIHPLTTTDGVTLEFSPAIDPNGIESDVLVSTGMAGQEYLRLIVFDVSAKKDLEATITCVDEATKLWS